jgi:hypothetical protein
MKGTQLTASIARKISALNALTVSTLAAGSPPVQSIVNALQPSVTALQTEMAPTMQCGEEFYFYQIITVMAQFLGYLQRNFPGD